MLRAPNAIVGMLVVGMLLAAVCPGRAAYETGGVVKAILSNGLTVLVRPEPEAGVAAIEVFVRVGAPDEDALNAGIGQLLAGSILAGTKSRSATKLARLVSEVGGNFHAVWQWNYLEVFAVTLPQTCEETFGLLADSILNSKLDLAALEYSRAAILREAERQEDPFNCAYTALRRLIQPGTPYDRPYLGDPEKIQEINQQELAKFYEDHFSADRVVISIVGNVDPQRVIRKVETYFGNMKRSARSPEGKMDARWGTGNLTIEKAGSASYVLLGYPAPGVDDQDYPAMCVANVLLGGNKSSLLFTKLREERGLGYQVGSVYPSLRFGSHIAAYLGMDSSRGTPDAIKAVQDAMLEQVDVLRSGRFADDDLERAKRFLIGNHALRHERTRDRAHYLGWHEVMGLGYQYDFQYSSNVKRVTREDVTRVCSRFLGEPTWVILSGTQNTGHEAK
ncbi:MAG TPA: pitrilysin family protein [Armatimonadota bacterium]|nr:pitrilysin family protein [Armatimonadota bacterium]